MQGHREAWYGPAVSPTLLSTITEAVVDAGRPWQARPLASVYPLRSFEALCVQSRQEGPVQTTAVDLALGLPMEGEKDLLGWWLRESEGTTGWLSVFTALPNRGVQDGCIACGDGLKRLPEAIEAVFPKTPGPLCLVHKVRNRLQDVPWQERRAVAAALRAIDGAAALPDAAHALERFAERWDAKSPAIRPSRTEEDFAAPRAHTSATAPTAPWLCIVDQRNTPTSEALGRLVTSACGIEEDLGEKEQRGSGPSMPTRAAFLRDVSHRLRFL